MKLLPWSFYAWAMRRFGLCWVSCVSLKRHGLRAWISDHRDGDWGAWRELFPSAICFAARPKPYDYCGVYPNTHPACPKEAQP